MIEAMRYIISLLLCRGGQKLKLNFLSFEIAEFEFDLEVSKRLSLSLKFDLDFLKVV